MSAGLGKAMKMPWTLAILCVWNCAGLAACDRAPREPAEVTTTIDEPPSGSGGSASSSPGGSGGTSAESCVIPLSEPPPQEVSSLEACPEDPEGRPEMPMGSIQFPDSPKAPTLKVELALNTEDRQHGLMYRPKLSDEEGMLFSWTTEEQRHFWMKNTCLALDMLFVDKSGTIAGILENVPPWNVSPTRTIPCPVAHVLEVRAGWTRAHGVAPGQKIVVSEAQP